MVGTGDRGRWSRCFDTRRDCVCSGRPLPPQTLGNKDSLKTCISAISAPMGEKDKRCRHFAVEKKTNVAAMLLLENKRLIKT